MYGSATSGSTHLIQTAASVMLRYVTDPLFIPVSTIFDQIGSSSFLKPLPLPPGIYTGVLVVFTLW